MGVDKTPEKKMIESDVDFLKLSVSVKSFGV